MKIGLRGAILFLALLLSTPLLFAQDDNTIDVVGSRIVTDVLLEFAGEDVNIASNGTTSGFDVFCAGEAAVTGATRPISVDEETACAENDVVFREYLIGYDAVALVGHPGLSDIACLAPFEINTLFAPTAEGVVTNWSEISEIDTELSIVLPPDNTSAYSLLSDQVDGISLRSDVTTEEDNTAILEAVSSTEGAIGLVSLSAISDEAAVHVFELENAELANCFAPTVETIESRQYPAATRLFIYVNDAATGIEDFVATVTSEDAAPALAEANLLAPSAATYEQNQLVREAAEAGRQFSLEVTEFEIPDSVIGTVEIAGGANLFQYINRVTSDFGTQYPAVTVNTAIQGEVNGFRRLCNGEISLVTSSRDLPEAEQENCSANNVNTYTFDLGKQATVLVANSESPYLECLTPEQVTSIWASTSEAATWNEIDESFPETAITLVGTPGSQLYTDLLLTPAEGAPLPVRNDTAEDNPDPVYRATAVGNVEGSLTYMAWDEYQSVLEDDPENIQLVAIDSGDGCVTPSVQTISDGSYAYTLDNKLIVNELALAEVQVQSLLWYVFSDENYNLIENNGLVGVAFADLPMIRDELQTRFNEAVAAAAAAPEVTPEPLEPEGTPEVTPETQTE